MNFPVDGSCYTTAALPYEFIAAFVFVRKVLPVQQYIVSLTNNMVLYQNSSGQVLYHRNNADTPVYALDETDVGTLIGFAAWHDINAGTITQVTQYGSLGATPIGNAEVVASAPTFGGYNAGASDAAKGFALFGAFLSNTYQPLTANAVVLWLNTCITAFNEGQDFPLIEALSANNSLYLGRKAGPVWPDESGNNDMTIVGLPELCSYPAR